uniref:Uncharacterized protein n=1 Tax=Phlebotomus papatasi TaxID=29031 RepID=A0A1B0DQZ3_PHLPP
MSSTWVVHNRLNYLPGRLWCICKQPHNNRFMICCDSCEDWFHGKCVNITKAMGQQMEEQGIEWRCPNCLKKGGSAKSQCFKLVKVGADSPLKHFPVTLLYTITLSNLFLSTPTFLVPNGVPPGLAAGSLAVIFVVTMACLRMQSSLQ